jgi:hypothetical protein
MPNRLGLMVAALAGIAAGMIAEEINQRRDSLPQTMRVEQEGR